MSTSDKIKTLQEQVDALRESIPRQFESISAVLSNIEAKLEASNSEMRAGGALRNLKQTGPVSEYATHFRKLSMKLKWNDAALMSQFKLNLKDFIKRELARRPVCVTLESLIATSIDIDNVLFMHQKSSSRGSPHHHQRHSHASSVSSSSSMSSSLSAAPIPMDLNIHWRDCCPDGVLTQ